MDILILTAAYGIGPRAWEAALDDILDRLVGPVHDETAPGKTTS